MNDYPVTYSIPSRTPGHAPHTLTLRVSRRAGVCGPAGTLYVTCDCAGGRNAFANAAIGRNSVCYAMRDAARNYRAALPPIRDAQDGIVRGDAKLPHLFRNAGNGWGECTVQGCGMRLQHPVHIGR